MYAQLQISGKLKHDVMLSPIESVIRTGKQNRVVLALENGYFKSVSVELGQVFEEYIEILAGLNKGDSIVTSAQFLIDSESSKSSDFKRMTAEIEPISVWVEGVVTAKSSSTQTVTIDHAPVEALKWPQMIMDFKVLNEENFAALEAGQSLHFEISKQTDGSYPISAIHIMGEVAPNNSETQATVKGVINAINMQSQVINISRDAIEKWGRGPATMDFDVLNKIDISTFKIGENIEFTFDTAQDFMIIEIQKIPDSDAENHNHMHKHH
jgi:Cu(I)/Ag(I) efflux system membrane fusion protein